MIKELFCDNSLEPFNCPFRETTPKICCCNCPLKWDCHAEQKEYAEQNDAYNQILPCVTLNEDEEENYCKNCQFLC